MNEIYIVGKRQNSTTGDIRNNIKGFDYKDETTGFKISVRDADNKIRIFGILIDIALLNHLVIQATS